MACRNDCRISDLMAQGLRGSGASRSMVQLAQAAARFEVSFETRRLRRRSLRQSPRRRALSPVEPALEGGQLGRGEVIREQSLV